MALLSRMSIFTRKERLMTRSVLIALVAVLAAGVGVLAWQLHEERKPADGVEISIGDHGVSIEKK